MLKLENRPVKRTEIKKFKRNLMIIPKEKINMKNKNRFLKIEIAFLKLIMMQLFMRMKEDHMKNGQLKPGYNLQIATNSQFFIL